MDEVKTPATRVYKGYRIEPAGYRGAPLAVLITTPEGRRWIKGDREAEAWIDAGCPRGPQGAFDVDPTTHYRGD